MISNRCARKSLVTNCNSIISKNYSRFLVDSNDKFHKVINFIQRKENCSYFLHKKQARKTQGRLT